MFLQSRWARFGAAWPEGRPTVGGGRSGGILMAALTTTEAEALFAEVASVYRHRCIRVGRQASKFVYTKVVE